MAQANPQATVKKATVAKAPAAKQASTAKATVANKPAAKPAPGPQVQRNDNTLRNVLIGLVVLLAIALLVVIWLYRPIPTSTPPSGGGDAPAGVSDCTTRAKDIGAPIGSPICKAPVSGAPAARVQSGSQIVFGTITFDAETRVWILEKFVVPNYANYAYDYEGRESNVLDAPFVVGSELNPVNGEKFTICWNTTSNGCVPPTEIKFFE